jgi:hypothetical protein
MSTNVVVSSLLVFWILSVAFNLYYYSLFFCCHFNNERQINGTAFIYTFSGVSCFFLCGMKLQFSENIKTIIKIQRFNWMASQALNSFLQAFLLEIQKKIIYQIMRVQPKKKQTENQTQNASKNFQYSNLYIFMLIYILFCCLVVFGKQSKRRLKKKQRKGYSKCRPLSFFTKEWKKNCSRKDDDDKPSKWKEGNKRFTLNWLSFKCWWFFFYKFCCRFSPAFRYVERCVHKNLKTFSVVFFLREGKQREKATKSRRERERETLAVENISVRNFCVCLIVSQHISVGFKTSAVSFFSSLRFSYIWANSERFFSGLRSASCMAFFAFCHRLFSLRNGYWISEILLLSTSLLFFSFASSSTVNESPKNFMVFGFSADHWINNCANILCFRVCWMLFFFSGSIACIFLCALRLPYLISNMKQRRRHPKKKKKSKFVQPGSILMINGLLHFFSLKKKKLFCIQEYKKPISLLSKKRKKMLRDLHGFFFASLLAFRLLYFLFSRVSSPKKKTVLNFINLSLLLVFVSRLCWCCTTTKFHLQIS